MPLNVTAGPKTPQRPFAFVQAVPPAVPDKVGVRTSPAASFATRTLIEVAEVTPAVAGPLGCVTVTTGEAEIGMVVEPDLFGSVTEVAVRMTVGGFGAAAGGV